MSGPARLCRRFIASTRAVAAIEFAIVMPVLALMFFGTFDAGRAIAIYMKIRSATFAIDAITNQYTTVQTSDLQSIAGAAAVILAPYPSSTSVLTVTVSQVKITAANTATVSWSYSLGGSARSRGSAVTTPGTLGTCSSYPCYLIFGEMSYQIYTDVRVFHDRGEYYTFRQPVRDPAQQQVRAVPDGRRQQLLTRPPGKAGDEFR